MKKLALVLVLLFVAAPAFADDAGIPAPPAGSVEPGPPVVAPAVEKPADKLHDPLTQPSAAFDDVKAAKKQGWAAAILCCLVMLTTTFARASLRWPSSALFAWFAKKKTAILVISGLGSVAAAAFNVLALGGTWMAVMWAGCGAALTMIAPTHAEPTK